MLVFVYTNLVTYIVYYTYVTKFNQAKYKNGNIKFITKGDIEHISILVPKNDKLLLGLNLLLDKVQKYNEENEKLASLRNFLLPMLMNGQINVDDIKI